jgi:hypothetical protein
MPDESASMPAQVKQLFDALVKDDLRESQPFSEEIVTANKVLLDSYARDDERALALALWLQKYQPCLFGRLAAKSGGMAYCFLTDRDLFDTDNHIEQKIQESRQLWKRRALRGQPIHGFMLVVASDRVLRAAPDNNLKQFSLRIQELAKWTTTPDIAGNDIVEEALYLQNPTDRQYVKFTFTVDYFAAAGDGRWWHDHRVPGGIAFTANSLGHMVRTNEWYRDKTGQIEWALRTAMLTIATAADTDQGKAIWLLDKRGDATFKEYQWTEAAPPADLQKLHGKDFTAYAGYLNTDHAVRSEFFDPSPVPQTKDKPYATDFTYIYDRTQQDQVKFMTGETVAEGEVFADIGAPSEWRFISADTATDRPPDATARILKNLSACESWRPSDEEPARFGG